MAWGAKPRGIADLVERLASNDATLTSLCLFRGRRLDDDDVQQLCAALASNTVLRELTVTAHPLSPAAAAAFARALASPTSALRSVDIGKSAFGDEVCFATSFLTTCDGAAGSLLLHHMQCCHPPLQSPLPAHNPLLHPPPVLRCRASPRCPPV